MSSQLNKQDLEWCLRPLPRQVRAALKGQPDRLCVAGGCIQATIA